MVKFLGLLVKGGDIFKNVITAPSAYRTLHGEGIAADRALIVGILLQSDDGNYFIEIDTGIKQAGISLKNKKKSVTAIKRSLKIPIKLLSIGFCNVMLKSEWG